MALTYLDPAFEWKTVFLGERRQGYLQTAKVWDDYLRWADDYRIELQEVQDLDGDPAHPLNMVTVVRLDLDALRNGVALVHQAADDYAPLDIRHRDCGGEPTLELRCSKCGRGSRRA